MLSFEHDTLPSSALLRSGVNNQVPGWTERAIVVLAPYGCCAVCSPGI